MSNAEKHLIEEIIKPTHELYFTPAEKNACGRPFRGNCFLINHTMASYTEIVHEDSHMLVVKITSTATPLLIIGIYLTSFHDAKSVEEYNEQLNLITSIIRMNDDCDPMIIGDFQSFPDKIYDMVARNNTKRNPLSKSLSNFITCNNLELVDVTKGNGPTVTYQHPTLKNTSYIDHIALRVDTDISILTCNVHTLNEYNISDHTPVSITLQPDPSLNDIIEKEMANNFIPKHYWKNDLFLKNYNLL